MIVPAILRHLCYHINNRDDNLDKSLDALGSILLLLHKQEPVRICVHVVTCCIALTMHAHVMHMYIVCLYVHVVQVHVHVVQLLVIVVQFVVS